MLQLTISVLWHASLLVLVQIVAVVAALMLELIAQKLIPNFNAILVLSRPLTEDTGALTAPPVVQENGVMNHPALKDLVQMALIAQQEQFSAMSMDVMQEQPHLGGQTQVSNQSALIVLWVSFAAKV